MLRTRAWATAILGVSALAGCTVSDTPDPEDGDNPFSADAGAEQDPGSGESGPRIPCERVVGTYVSDPGPSRSTDPAYDCTAPGPMTTVLTDLDEAQTVDAEGETCTVHATVYSADNCERRELITCTDGSSIQVDCISDPGADLLRCESVQDFGPASCVGDITFERSECPTWAQAEDGSCVPCELDAVCPGNGECVAGTCICGDQICVGDAPSDPDPTGTPAQGPYPMCDRDNILPPPTWDLDADGSFDEPPYSRMQLDACLDACPNLTDACIESAAECAGFDDFDFCVRLVAGECASQPESTITCYDEWQDYTCCIEAECPTATGDALTSCIQDNCIDWTTRYFDCVFANDACIAQGISRCAPGSP